MRISDECKNNCDLVNTFYLLEKSLLAKNEALTTTLNTIHEHIHFKRWAEADAAYHEWERGQK